MSQPRGFRALRTQGDACRAGHPHPGTPLRALPAAGPSVYRLALLRPPLRPPPRPHRLPHCGTDASLGTADSVAAQYSLPAIQHRSVFRCLLRWVNRGAHGKSCLDSYIARSPAALGGAASVGRRRRVLHSPGLARGARTPPLPYPQELHANVCNVLSPPGRAPAVPALPAPSPEELRALGRPMLLPSPGRCCQWPARPGPSSGSQSVARHLGIARAAPARGPGTPGPHNGAPPAASPGPCRGQGQGQGQWSWPRASLQHSPGPAPIPAPRARPRAPGGLRKPPPCP